MVFHDNDQFFYTVFFNHKLPVQNELHQDNENSNAMVNIVHKPWNPPPFPPCRGPDTGRRRKAAHSAFLMNMIRAEESDAAGRFSAATPGAISSEYQKIHILDSTP